MDNSDDSIRLTPKGKRTFTVAGVFGFIYLFALAGMVEHGDDVRSILLDALQGLAAGIGIGIVFLVLMVLWVFVSATVRVARDTARQWGWAFTLRSLVHILTGRA